MKYQLFIEMRRFAFFCILFTILAELQLIADLSCRIVK